MVTFDTRYEVHELENAEELQGKLGQQDQEDKLMRSVLENDKETIEQGKLLQDSINQGMQSLTPDLLYDQLVSSYQLAKKLFGPSLIKLASGYDPDYVKKNIRIPEFQKELKFKLQTNLDALKKKRLLDADYMMTDKGLELASLVMYFQELEKLVPKGILGQKIHKKISLYGGKEDVRDYKKGDRYRDIAIKKSAKRAIRRGHTKLDTQDLQVHEKQSKGQNYIVYAIDASGSMKGNKIDACKRAGIALAYQAISEKDKVGLIVFGSEIKTTIEPTSDFPYLLRSIAAARASRQTEFVTALRKAIELFPNEDITKHVILITDALPTIGDNPQSSTLEAASEAQNNGITISIVGINLDTQGKELAEKIAEIGNGKLYVVKDAANVDSIVLEDYYALS